MFRWPTRVPEEILSDTNRLNGKTIVITGASYGIGFESVKAFAKMGAERIIVASRDRESGQKAIDAIKQEPNTENTIIEFAQLDLGSIASTKSFADDLLNREDLKIDFIILNAGTAKSGVTIDGFETTFQTNHLGHFIIINKLFEKMCKDGTRVIGITSSMHYDWKEIRLDKVKTDPNSFGVHGYAHSKLLNILMIKKLQKEFERVGTKAVAVVLNPGMVGTQISTTAPFPLNYAMQYVVLPLFGQYVPDGAMTIIHCVVSDDLVPGAYYEFNAVSKESEPSKNEQFMEEAWRVSKEYAQL
jgi:NAD(P)-dependent dehydrogenase (short-subunit alcohol dehydrogenase family)